MPRKSAAATNVSFASVSRLTLAIVFATIMVLSAIHYNKRPATRSYTAPVFVLGFVNLFFYGASFSWRMGLFRLPTPDFFSSLSNIRSWGLAVTVLVVMVFEVRDLWIGE
jgi:hypothetical protein